MRVDKIISEFTEQERDSYKGEKMMINLLQQAVKEDIFVLLQHDDNAYSIWKALKKKFEGSTEMLQSKAALLKKEFELFTCMPGETTKTLIERYCHLLRTMSQLKITKTPAEWATIAQFIEKLEAQDLEQQKIARMNSSTHQQDIKLYYKGKVQTAEASPKIQTAFSAGNQSEPSSQGSVNTSGFQNYTEEILKSHMGLLVTALEAYEGLIAGRIGNPMLTKEDYDQIDAEELELMDIKWALASVLRRAEKFRLVTGRTDFLDANLSNLGFDKSKVVCFRCREKGHFKRECKNQQPRGEKESSGKDDYYRKTIYQQITHQPHQQKEPQTAHGRMIEDANRKAYFGIMDQDDEKMAEGFSWDKFIPADSNVHAFIAHIIRKPEMLKEWMEVLSDEEKSEDEESVSSENSSSETSDSDEEIEQINIGKTHLSSDSFEFYFAEKLKKLKERKAAKEMKEVKVIEKIVEVEKRVEVEKIVEVTKPCLKCLESCKQCIEKDERFRARKVERTVVI
ncbi:putative transcription factor interactor and regulator CCHC(Zn) family [Helianthus annuus]|nr:putative transcription factor interactor and regulator CCHC(Zn) family [Helianthus annuus]